MSLQNNLIRKYWYIFLPIISVFAGVIGYLIYRYLMNLNSIDPLNVPNETYSPKNYDSSYMHDSEDTNLERIKKKIHLNMFNTFFTNANDGIYNTFETMFPDDSQDTETPSNIFWFDAYLPQNEEPTILLSEDEILQYEQMMIKISLYILTSLAEIKLVIQESNIAEYRNILELISKQKEELIISEEYSKKFENIYRNNSIDSYKYYTLEDVIFYLTSQIALLKINIFNTKWYSFTEEDTLIEDLFSIHYFWQINNSLEPRETNEKSYMERNIIKLTKNGLEINFRKFKEKIRRLTANNANQQILCGVRRYPTYLICGIKKCGVLIEMMKAGSNWSFATNFYAKRYIIIGLVIIENLEITYLILNGINVCKITDLKELQMNDIETMEYFTSIQDYKMVALFKRIDND